MSEATPFNSLGQIISRGGEIAIARLVARGFTPSEIKRITLSRFGPLAGEVEQAFLDLAYRMAQAGENIIGLDPTHPIPPDLIPTNPELFGSSPEGRRLILGVFVNAEDQKQQREVQQIWPDIPTVEQIMEQAWAEYNRRAALYPERFTDLSKIKQIEIANTIAWIEKRF